MGADDAARAGATVIGGVPPEPRPGRGDGGPDGAERVDVAAWRRLVEAEGPEEFCDAWLDLQARFIERVAAAVVLFRDPESGHLKPQAAWPRGVRDLDRFRKAISRAVEARKGVVVQHADPAVEEDEGAERAYHLAFPVLAAGRFEGVVALEIDERPQIELQRAMRRLQWGAAWLENWVLEHAVEPGTRENRRLEAVLELTALVLEEHGFRGAATAFVTELATRLECDRVSFGILRGAQVKVHALSHSAQFGKQMNLIRSIGAAMAESVDQQSSLVLPQPEAAPQRVLQAHEQLARSHGTPAICTVPFFDRDGVARGALTLERATGEPFDVETVELCEAAAALAGPILEEKQANDRFLVTKIGDALKSQVVKLVGPRYALRKLLAALLLAAAVFFTFAKGTYRVSAKTILEGEVQRAVVAPYRGFVDEAAARAGDVVEEGQLLVALDTHDLALQRDKLASERGEHRLEHRRAMAERNTAAMSVLRQKIRQAEAELALVSEQIARASIVAPFAGVVVNGDLSQALGAPVEAGQLLFEIAPLDAYRVMLHVDEKDIDEVVVGQAGTLKLTALPDREVTFTVARVTPVSRTEEGQTFFEVQAELAEATELLRPGMEGFGKIEVDERRVIWIWTHDLVDWARLKIWSWTP